MSAANVTFETMAYEPVNGSGAQRFNFQCPKVPARRCEGLLIAGTTGLKRDPQNRNDGIAQWDFDGNYQHPTFSPSVDCHRCPWHGYIRKSRCVDVNGRDEPEVNV